MFDAILTGMEAALLRGHGLPAPKVEPMYDVVRDRTDYRAIIVRPSGGRVEALGSSPDIATRNVIRLAIGR